MCGRVCAIGNGTRVVMDGLGGLGRGIRNGARPYDGWTGRLLRWVDRPVACRGWQISGNFSRPRHPYGGESVDG